MSRRRGRLLCLLALATAGCGTGRASAELLKPPLPPVMSTDGQISVQFASTSASAVPLPVTGNPIRQADGGVALFDADGGLVTGLAPPTGLPATLVVRGETVRVARVTDPAADAPAGLAVIEVGHDLLDNVQWVRRDGRDSLAVTPSDWQRRWPSTEVVTAGWQQVVARVPEADTPGMADQYRCHAQFAPDKEVFHLEPWRPAVGYLQTIASACNPGGGDPDLSSKTDE